MKRPPIYWWVTEITRVLLMLLCFTWFFHMKALAQQVNNNDSLILAFAEKADTVTKVGILRTLARNHFPADFNYSVYYAEKALHLADSLGNEEEVIKCLTLYAEVTSYAGLYDDASSSLSRLLAIGEKNKDENLIRIATLNMGSFQLMVGNPEEALPLLIQADSSLKQTKNFLQQESLRGAAIAVNNNIGLAYSRLENFEKAELYYNLALSISQSYYDTIGLIRTLTNIGLLNNKESNFKEALQYYQYALALNQKQNNLIGSGIIWLSLGEIYDELDEVENAEGAFLKAYDLGQQMHANVLIKEAAEKLTSFYQALNQPDKGLKYLKIAKEREALINESKAKEAVRRDEVLKTTNVKENIQIKNTFVKQYQSIIVGAFVGLFTFLILFVFFRKRA